MVRRVCVMFVLLAASHMFGQGIPPFSTIAGGPADRINLSNLSITLFAPIRNKIGAIPFNMYERGNFEMVRLASWSPDTIYGAQMQGFVSISHVASSKKCQDGRTTTVFNNFAVIDETGAHHPFSPIIQVDSLGCFQGFDTDGFPNDGTPYFLQVSDPPLTKKVTFPSGLNFTVGGNLADPHGNSISGSGGVTTDTLGQTAIISTATSSGLAYTYTDAAGVSRSLNENRASFTEHTVFNCSGVSDINTSGVLLPVGTTYPDGTSLTIGYELTPGFSTHRTGRLASLTLPTGGTITYSYSGGTNGINCVDGSPAVLKRTTSDGTVTYTHTPGTGTASTTKVTDASGNDVVYSFSGNFVTQVLSYQGSSTTGTLLQTQVFCYNGSSTNCPTATVTSPVAQRDVYTTPAGMTSASIVKTTYDNIGRTTETKQYDFGGSTPILDTVTVYGSWNGTTCVSVGSNILDRPCSVTVTPAGAGAPISQTLYTYDSTGNNTQTQRLVSGTANYLISSASYYPNGSLQTSTDPSGTVSNVTNAACNSLLATSVTKGNLSTQFTWNCDGGVMTSQTDANNKTTTYNYVNSSGSGDPFWRTMSVIDPLDNTTTSTYTPNSTENSMLFNNGASSVDFLTTVDSYGRKRLTQTRRSPTGADSSNFDTVSYGYDANGRSSSASLPCIASAGASCTGPSTTTTYDGMGRVSQVTDSGGGYTAYTFTKNDVVVTLGPTPAGENNKKRQLEYDGLGRLASVCEILSTGGSSCGQSTAASGYKTSYTYSTPTGGGSQMLVAQGAQSRTYVYDGLGRLTSETNPESGTTTYIYDTTTGPCFGISAGDLAETIDNSGTHICYYYDSLHRVFTEYTATPSGAVSNCRNFNYGDYNVIPPSGITATNGNGRAVNANVQPDCQTAYSVDEWFSYDADGHETDLWEATPHSAGYYHTTAAYWANDVLQSLGGIPAYTTITYGVDGEGRASTAKQGTTKIVCDSSCSMSSTTFDPGGNPRVLKIGGTSDNDTYTYDPNTGRMSSYTFTVGATPNSTSGGLTWNQNGMLRQLAITDGFNAGGTQTCNFGTSTVMGYDDLGRLLNANCGSLWAQSFSYDQYGNVTKAGSISWACASCYNGKNQYTTSISSLISYDADGRLLDDSFHRYTWDGYGNLSTIAGPNASITCGTSGTCLTYDAFGRMVEKNVSGTYTEILYSPVGKTAIMQGQTTTQAYLPLPAGETLFASGPTGTNRFFWHKDWLGTVRLSSSVAGRTIAYDRAFAPFGERYDNFGGAINSNFTGDTADTISDLFDTPNREYHATQGRWISPDPAGLSAVDMNHPQSWNRYAYVLNNPLSNTDPNGLDWCADIEGNAIPDDAGGDNNVDCHSADGTWQQVQDPSQVANVSTDVSQPPTIVDTIDLFNLWVSGQGPSTINYGPNDGVTNAMRLTRFVQNRRQQYIDAGCPARFPMSQGHFSAWAESAENAAISSAPALDIPMNWTQFEVGGYSGSITGSGDTTTFTINNPMSFSSFIGQSTWGPSVGLPPYGSDNPGGPNGPMHNINQTFQWTETGLCGRKSNG